MGLLDGTTHSEYYQGSDYGNYQFVSLDDIITQFQIIYIGEDKLISKAKRADVAFHAQRALAELSFDTFKCYKSQQIELPPSLTMILPHDYVNYTKVSWADSAGIKHPLYPTKHTSNPFQVRQDSTGDYVFAGSESQYLENGSFEGDVISPWFTSKHLDGSTNPPTNLISVDSGVLKFKHISRTDPGGNFYGDAVFALQEIDVSGVDFVNISADGVAVAASGSQGAGQLRFGLSTSKPDNNTYPLNNPIINPNGVSSNSTSDMFDVGYIEWIGVTNTQQETAIDVSAYDTLFATVLSYIPLGAASLSATNTIDNISVVNTVGASGELQAAEGNEIFSSTWNSYKSHTPSENNNNHYAQHSHSDHDHFGSNNERYGLEPSHAQINGSFYIDDRLGKIHFSSNISGKTVILDYISDSLGTDGEMQVPKLAEDAMYKHILCDMMSARANVGRGQLAYYKKDKFAAVRKAKLRLSSIKLEELTQVLRGQSKHIKH
jgi:hypothetical protein